MTMTQQQLLDYITENLGVPNDDVTSETLLFSSGLIDSFNMVDLIVFIEENCGTTIKPAEVNLDNLDSIDRILAFLDSRSG